MYHYGNQCQRDQGFHRRLDRFDLGQGVQDCGCHKPGNKGLLFEDEGIR